MKNIIKNCNFKAAYMMMTLFFLQTVAWAQEKTTTKSTTKVEIDASGASNWFADNWIWVIGGIVFIIVLLALLGGGGRSYRSTRTVVREDPLTGNRTRTTTTTDDEVV